MEIPNDICYHLLVSHTKHFRWRLIAVAVFPAPNCSSSAERRAGTAGGPASGGEEGRTGGRWTLQLQ